MATQTQIEFSKDPTGLITKTITKQSFATEDPSPDCRSYRVTKTDGVFTIVEEFFDDMVPVYSIDVSTTQEPVETHPYFSELTDKNKKDWAMWKQNPNNPDLNGWQPSTETGEVFSTLFVLWKKGVTNYLAPRTVIKCTTLETTAPKTADVGILSATGYPGDAGAVDFILTGLSGQQEGNKWRITREYLSSARGTNWEEVLYT